jgi:AmmeMemoRadiSam system protein B/AmmeMemoRadiSam system protein A
MKDLYFGMFALFLLSCAFLFESKLRGSGQAPRTRKPAVAGSFYPADPAELAEMIDDFLSKVTAPLAKRLTARNVVAIISPHAGYMYSGPVAAYSYASLKGRKFDRVVIVAPSHYEPFDYASVYDGAAYLTPLDEVRVDQDFAAKLARSNSLIKLSEAGHTPSGRAEHAIEVQLPFLQRVLGSFQLVPIILGDQSYNTCRALGVALASLIQESGGPESTLIVASSDLSHYRTYEQAVEMDHKTLNGIREYDYYNLARNLEMRVWEACGGGPIASVMIAAERLGATQAKLLHYANSGDVNGDHSHVVGYGSVALVKAAGDVEVDAQPAEAEISLTKAEKNALLQIARNSVETAVCSHGAYECSTGGFPTLARECGAFVTLTKKDELRGCIGHISAHQPLYLTIRDVAARAALHDSRFHPVEVSELPGLHYEISVLSSLRRVRDVREIIIGQTGLLICDGTREGLLLPQVATERKWDRPTLLQQLCRKAGLPANAWQDPDADVFRFTAVVFGEEKTA